MAGDWIPIDHDFESKPEVLAIHEATGVSLGEILRRFHRWWSTCDRQTLDGVLPGTGLRALGVLTGAEPEFWETVRRVTKDAWITLDQDGSVVCPKFLERFGVTAKARIAEAKRKRREYAEMIRDHGESSEKVRRKSGESPEKNQEKNRRKSGEKPGEKPEALARARAPEPDPDPVSGTRGQIQEPDPGSGAAAPPSSSGTTKGGDGLTLDEVIREWNSVPKLGDLPGVIPCRAPNEPRRSAFRQRLKDPFWREHWLEAISMLSTRRFAQGGGDKGWRASIDWFLRPGSVAKIMEGMYGERLAARSDPRGNMAAVERYLAFKEGEHDE